MADMQPTAQPNYNSAYPMLAGGMGMLGAGVGNLMSPWKNPSDSAMNYMDQIPNMISQYSNPYIQAGQQALPGLQNNYGQLMNSPGQKLNTIGQDYHQSPGFQFALQQALQGSDHAAAAGGMAGSGQNQQQDMTLATNLANQDYNDWMKNALGLYGAGVNGEQGLYDTGAKTGVQAGQDMASILANKAKLAYEGQNAENENEGGMWGSLLGGAGTVAGSVFGGPMGGMIAGQIGKYMGGNS